MSEIKVAIIMAGGGAAGKTTTTHAFGNGTPQEFQALRTVRLRHGKEDKVVKWCLYDNCGVTGNHRSGTDSNTGPDLVRVALNEVLKVRDVAIIDGMVSSPKWVEYCVNWREKHDGNLEMLLVHFDLHPEELLNRLASRRGVDKETIRDHMYPKCESLTRRAMLLVKHVHNLWPWDYHVLRVLSADRPDKIAVAMQIMVEDIQDGRIR